MTVRAQLTVQLHLTQAKRNVNKTWSVEDICSYFKI